MTSYEFLKGLADRYPEIGAGIPLSSEVQRSIGGYISSWKRELKQCLAMDAQRLALHQAGKIVCPEFEPKK